MANNRLYLKCRNCGKRLYVDKNFGEPYHISAEKLAEINTFLSDHAYCANNDDTYSVGGWFALEDEYHEDR